MVRRTEPHGEDGHLNTFVRDQEAYHTGFGQHARVVVCHPRCGEVYCRVDYAHEMRRPTDAEIVAAVQHPESGVKGRWKVKSRVSYRSGTLDREDVILV